MTQDGRYNPKFAQGFRNPTPTWGDIEGNIANQVDLLAALTSVLVPAGTVMPFAGAAAPTGYLLCNGSAISRTTYAALFAVLGTTYDTQYNEVTGTTWAAPAGTDFRVPDYRGSFLRGVGTPSGLDAVTLAGRQAQKTAKNGVSATTNIGHSHSLGTTNVSLAGGTAASAGAHNHGLHAQSPASGLGSGAVAASNAGGTGWYPSEISTEGAHTHTVSGTTNIDHSHTLGITNVSATVSGDNETRPMNKGVNYIIKT
jgi:microcystin-dependent protein